MADKRKTNSEKKQKSQAATLKEVICRLGRYRIFLVFSILLATVSVALTLYIPKLTGHAVDYVIGKGKVNFPGVIQVMIQIGVCTLITALAQWLMNVCNNKMTVSREERHWNREELYITLQVRRDSVLPTWRMHFTQ